MVECSDKMWSTGQENGKPVQHSCLENPMRISVQFNSVAHLYLTLCNPANHSRPGLPAHHQFLECTQTHVHWVSGAIQPSHPLSSPSPPTLNLSQHQVLFKWVSSSHQVAKVLEFQLPHQFSNEHPGLICFRMDWLDLLAVQGTPESLLQHRNSNVSLQCSAFFILPTLTYILDYWKNHSLD